MKLLITLFAISAVLSVAYSLPLQGRQADMQNRLKKLRAYVNSATIASQKKDHVLTLEDGIDEDMDFDIDAAAIESILGQKEKVLSTIQTSSDIWKNFGPPDNNLTAEDLKRIFGIPE